MAKATSEQIANGEKSIEHALYSWANQSPDALTNLLNVSDKEYSRLLSNTADLDPAGRRKLRSLSILVSELSKQGFYDEDLASLCIASADSELIKDSRKKVLGISIYKSSIRETIECFVTVEEGRGLVDRPGSAAKNYLQEALKNLRGGIPSENDPYRQYNRGFSLRSLRRDNGRGILELIRIARGNSSTTNNGNSERRSNYKSNNDKIFIEYSSRLNNDVQSAFMKIALDMGRNFRTISIDDVKQVYEGIRDKALQEAGGDYSKLKHNSADLNRAIFLRLGGRYYSVQLPNKYKGQVIKFEIGSFNGRLVNLFYTEVKNGVLKKVYIDRTNILEDLAPLGNPHKISPIEAKDFVNILSSYFDSKILTSSQDNYIWRKVEIWKQTNEPIRPKPADLDPNRNHYQVLKVRRAATIEEISKVYKAYYFKLQRDFQAGRIEPDEYHKKQVEANTAKDILTDPEKRREYDNELLMKAQANPYR